MSILLADLVARLTADIPAVSGVPSANQYTQAVKDALSDLSRRASVTRVATLAVVAGQASYTVPSDFQKLIRLAAIGVAYYPMGLGLGVPGGTYWEPPYSGTIVTPAGLVPFTDVYREQITMSGNQLTIYPTPQTSADRQLVYAAGDALNDAGDVYETLTEDRAQVALLLASATCLDRIGSSGGVVADKVEGLGFAVDAKVAGAEIRMQSQGLREQYLAAVASLNAGVGGLH